MLKATSLKDGGLFSVIQPPVSPDLGKFGFLRRTVEVKLQKTPAVSTGRCNTI
jgi:hypothetical protein